MDTDYYTKLSLDMSSPFFNKATQQTTAPGSTLKLLSAVTGMMEDLVDDDTYIECTGKFDLVTQMCIRDRYTSLSFYVKIKFDSLPVCKQSTAGK